VPSKKVSLSKAKTVSAKPASKAKTASAKPASKAKTAKKPKSTKGGSGGLGSVSIADMIDKTLKRIIKKYTSK
jgi:hypothetical protein